MKKYVIKAVGYDMWVVRTEINEETVFLMPILTVFLKNAKKYNEDEAQQMLKILNYQAKYEKYILKEVE